METMHDFDVIVAGGGTSSQEASTVTSGQPLKTGGVGLPKPVMEKLYQVAAFLDQETRQKLGLTLQIPIFIKDPLVALENPALGVQEVTVRFEAGLFNGPPR